MLRFTKRQIKREILKVHVDQPRGRHVHKMSILGYAFAGGGALLDLQLHELDPDERVLAGNAYDELREDGLIAPSYLDLSSPDDSCWITDNGRAMLARNLLDDLDEALEKIAPGLIDVRDGAHEAMHSSGPDSARHAAASGRELLDQVLHKMAPNDVVKSQPWWDRVSDADSGVSRQQRVRLALQKLGRIRLMPSDREDQELEQVWERIKVAGRDLESIKHRRGSTAALSAADAIHDVEIALKELLLGVAWGS